MTEADDAIAAGMAAIALSRSADYASELRSDLEDAVAHFDRALSLVPDQRDALAHKGLCLARLARYAEAAVVLQAALGVDADAPELWLARGRCLAELGRLGEAVADFDETLRRSPDDQEAIYRRAEALDALGRDQEALQAWDRVLSLPDNRTIDEYDQPFRVLTSDFRRSKALAARAAVLARKSQT